MLAESDHLTKITDYGSSIPTLPAKYARKDGASTSERWINFRKTLGVQSAYGYWISSLGSRKSVPDSFNIMRFCLRRRLISRSSKVNTDSIFVLLTYGIVGRA